MADETMFARLCRSVWDTMERECFPDTPERWIKFEEAHAAEAERIRAIVRALLAELRTPTETVLAWGRDTLASRSPEYDVPYDITDRVFTDMINCILAEAGGSGG